VPQNAGANSKAHAVRLKSNRKTKKETNVSDHTHGTQHTHRTQQRD